MRARARLAAATLAGGLGVVCALSCIPGRDDQGALLEEALLAEPWVRLPEGTTPLAELGTYRVAYQLAGEERVAMPPGWSGHFTEDVGIAYYDAGVRRGRRATVLHCPWRRGPGSVCLEYDLELGDRTPVRLEFAIAMREDVTEKSDGVTFSAYVVYRGVRKEFFREHTRAAAWKVCRFDLSPFAGERFTLGFQTEPGPANNSGFDFSLLGEPTLTVGEPGDRGEDVLRTITRSRAYRRTARRDLRRLANTPEHGIAPSTNDEHHTRLEVRPHAAGFFYHGTDCQIEYALPLTADLLDGLTVRVDAGQPFRPCAGGGVWFAPDPERPHDFRRPDRAEPLGTEDEHGELTTRWRYRLGERSAEVAWTFRLVGKALVLRAESQDTPLARLTLGRPLTRGLRRSVTVPYLGFAQLHCLRPQNVFVMSTLDWTRSLASRSAGTEAVYVPALDGARQPLREVGAVAVSPELGEVLPNIPHPPSPYLGLLGDKIVLDIWGGTFDQGADLLRTLKSHGVDHAAVIWHNWQRYGYDVKLPDHLPANPALGGDAALRRLADAARQAGYLFALHENYIDFYPDAPSYEPEDVVRTPAGDPSKAWFHPGTEVQSFALKAGRMLHYAAQNSPEIHRRFGTTAAYLDVHTCVPPWHHVDYDPATDFAASQHLKVLVHRRLFQYERDTHGGPLFGEGANHFFWAGLVDGVEAQVRGGEDCPPLLDYDLLKLHPQMVNHGMGYYTRWLRTGRQTRWGTDAPTPAQLDKYRAHQLAYGHAGFVGAPIVSVPHLVWREHNLVQPVQTLYTTAKATEILYEVDGRLVTASAAVPSGRPLDRVRVAYESGLVLHVNLGAEPWEVRGHVLPQYGFLAEGPGLVAYTAERDGVIADYAENQEFLFADARTHVYRPWEHGLRDIEPRVESVQDRGDGTFDITYAWHVGEALDRDFIAFVHFVNPAVTEGEDICFQDDHEPSPPTPQWQPGRVVTDGPRRVAVPAGQDQTLYEVRVGLYERGGSRLKLRGVDDGQRRILVGRLAVTRQGGRVTEVRLLPVAERRQEQAERRRRFDERMNLAGRLVDFGSVRTDGSVKIYKGGPSLEVLAVPRERDFVVQVDVAALRPGRRADRAVVRVFDADGEPLGEAPANATRRWLSFRAGAPRVARYAITFAEGEEP